MPMIDVVTPEGIFHAAAGAALLERATAAVLQWERIEKSPLAVAHTGAYLHVLPTDRVAAGGRAARVVRITVTTPSGSLSQAQRDGLTQDLTALVGELSNDAALRERTWVLFQEAVDGGWGIGGKAYTSAALGAAVVASLKA